MNTIKIDTCKNCNNVFDTKIYIDKHGEHRFKTICSFCSKRNKKIKRIKSKILNLQWELFKMNESI